MQYYIIHSVKLKCVVLCRSVNFSDRFLEYVSETYPRRSIAILRGIVILGLVTYRLSNVGIVTSL